MFIKDSSSSLKKTSKLINIESMASNNKVQEKLDKNQTREEKVLVTRCTKRITNNNQMTTIYLLSLATFAIILASSINSSDGAALNAVGKYKSPKDRGK